MLKLKCYEKFLKNNNPDSEIKDKIKLPASPTFFDSSPCEKYIDPTSYYDTEEECKGNNHFWIDKSNYPGATTSDVSSMGTFSGQGVCIDNADVNSQSNLRLLLDNGFIPGQDLGSQSIPEKYRRFLESKLNNPRDDCDRVDADCDFIDKAIHSLQSELDSDSLIEHFENMDRVETNIEGFGNSESKLNILHNHLNTYYQDNRHSNTEISHGIKFKDSQLCQNLIKLDSRCNDQPIYKCGNQYLYLQNWGDLAARGGVGGPQPNTSWILTKDKPNITVEDIKEVGEYNQNNNFENYFKGFSGTTYELRYIYDYSKGYMLYLFKGAAPGARRGLKDIYSDWGSKSISSAINDWYLNSQKEAKPVFIERKEDDFETKIPDNWSTTGPSPDTLQDFVESLKQGNDEKPNLYYLVTALDWIHQSWPAQWNWINYSELITNGYDLSSQKSYFKVVDKQNMNENYWNSASMQVRMQDFLYPYFTSNTNWDSKPSPTAALVDIIKLNEDLASKPWYAGEFVPSQWKTGGDPAEGTEEGKGFTVTVPSSQSSEPYNIKLYGNINQNDMNRSPDGLPWYDNINTCGWAADLTGIGDPNLKEKMKNQLSRKCNRLFYRGTEYSDEKDIQPEINIRDNKNYKKKLIDIFDKKHPFYPQYNGVIQQEGDPPSESWKFISGTTLRTQDPDDNQQNEINKEIKGQFLPSFCHSMVLDKSDLEKLKGTDGTITGIVPEKLKDTVFCSYNIMNKDHLVNLNNANKSIFPDTNGRPPQNIKDSQYTTPLSFIEQSYLGNFGLNNEVYTGTSEDTGSKWPYYPTENEEWQQVYNQPSPMELSISKFDTNRSIFGATWSKGGSGNSYKYSDITPEDTDLMQNSLESMLEGGLTQQNQIKTPFNCPQNYQYGNIYGGQGKPEVGQCIFSRCDISEIESPEEQGTALQGQVSCLNNTYNYLPGTADIMSREDDQEIVEPVPWPIYHSQEYLKCGGAGGAGGEAVRLNEYSLKGGPSELPAIAEKNAKTCFNWNKEIMNAWAYTLEQIDNPENGFWGLGSGSAWSPGSSGGWGDTNYAGIPNLRQSTMDTYNPSDYFKSVLCETLWKANSAEEINDELDNWLFADLYTEGEAGRVQLPEEENLINQAMLESEGPGGIMMEYSDEIDSRHPGWVKRREDNIEMTKIKWIINKNKFLQEFEKNLRFIPPLGLCQENKDTDLSGRGFKSFKWVFPYTETNPETGKKDTFSGGELTMTPPWINIPHNKGNVFLAYEVFPETKDTSTSVQTELLPWNSGTDLDGGRLGNGFKTIKGTIESKPNHSYDQVFLNQQQGTDQSGSYTWECNVRDGTDMENSTPACSNLSGNRRWTDWGDDLDKSSWWKVVSPFGNRILDKRGVSKWLTHVVDTSISEDRDSGNPNMDSGDETPPAAWGGEDGRNVPLRCLSDSPWDSTCPTSGNCSTNFLYGVKDGKAAWPQSCDFDNNLWCGKGETWWKQSSYNYLYDNENRPLDCAANIWQKVDAWGTATDAPTLWENRTRRVTAANNPNSGSLLPATATENQWKTTLETNRIRNRGSYNSKPNMNPDSGRPTGESLPTKPDKNNPPRCELVGLDAGGLLPPPHAPDSNCANAILGGQGCPMCQPSGLNEVMTHCGVSSGVCSATCAAHLNPWVTSCKDSLYYQGSTQNDWRLQALVDSCAAVDPEEVSIALREEAMKEEHRADVELINEKRAHCEAASSSDACAAVDPVVIDDRGSVRCEWVQPNEEACFNCNKWEYPVGTPRNDIRNNWLSRLTGEDFGEFGRSDLGQGTKEGGYARSTMYEPCVYNEDCKGNCVGVKRTYTLTDGCLAENIWGQDDICNRGLRGNISYASDANIWSADGFRMFHEELPDQECGGNGVNLTLGGDSDPENNAALGPHNNSRRHGQSWLWDKYSLDHQLGRLSVYDMHRRLPGDLINDPQNLTHTEDQDSGNSASGLVIPYKENNTHDYIKICEVEDDTPCSRLKDDGGAEARKAHNGTTCDMGGWYASADWKYNANVLLGPYDSDNYCMEGSVCQGTADTGRRTTAADAGGVNASESGWTAYTCQKPT